MKKQDQEKSKNKSEVAIKVDNVSKEFKIPHENINSLRGAFVNAFRRKRYEKFKALDNVSFDVKKGEFFGVIGRNGSGKSTLLKILAGIYKPDSGEVKVNGMISPFLELGIGFNPELSGRDNVYLNATVLGMSKKEIDEKFDSIVEFSELRRFIDQKLKNYSSGMKVRLAFAVSIHANREILLMDEVLAVGDNNFQSKCLEEFNKYREMGRTVIIVTHNTTIVEQYCDRAILLRNGSIEIIGKSDDVTDKYIKENIKDKKGRLNLNKKDDKIIEKSIDDEDENNEEKDIYITNVEILNNDYKKINEIVKGQNFRVRVSLSVGRILKDLKDFFVAIQIFDRKKGYFLSGADMDSEDIKHSWKQGINIVELEFRNSMFNFGEVYIKAIILKKEFGTKTVIDLYSDSSTIEVVKPDGTKNGGIMFVEHKWL